MSRSNGVVSVYAPSNKLLQAPLLDSGDPEDPDRISDVENENENGEGAARKVRAHLSHQIRMEHNSVIHDLWFNLKHWHPISPFFWMLMYGVYGTLAVLYAYCWNSEITGIYMYVPFPYAAQNAKPEQHNSVPALFFAYRLIAALQLKICVDWVVCG